MIRKPQDEEIMRKMIVWIMTNKRLVNVALEHNIETMPKNCFFSVSSHSSCFSR